MEYRYRVKRFVSWLLFALFMYGKALSHTNISYQDIVFNQLNISDGLPGAVVNTISQDKNGYLWVGTFNGLSGFDGYRFKVPDLSFLGDIPPPKKVKKIIAVPHSSSLFLNTADQVLMYDPCKQEAKLVFIASKNETVIDLLSEDANSLWILTTRQLLKLSIDRNGLSQNNEVLASYDEISHGAIVQDSLHIWFAFERLGKYIKKTREFFILPSKQYSDYETLPLKTDFYTFGEIFDLVLSNGNSLWIATSCGLVRYNFDNENFERPFTRIFMQRFPNGMLINCLFEDKKGMLWCGTRKDGVIVVNPNSSEIVHVYSQINNEVNDFFYSNEYEDGTLWISTENGLHYGDITTSYLSIYSDLNQVNIRSVSQSEDGGIWIGSVNNGVYFKEKNMPKFQKADFVPQQFGAVGAIILNNQMIWLSSWNGLLVLHEKAKQKTQVWSVADAASNLKGWVLNDMFTDCRNRLWIASLTGDFQRFDFDSHDFVQYNIQTHNTRQNTKIFTIYQPHGRGCDTLWLGTSSGLIRFLSHSGDYKVFTGSEHPKDVFAISQLGSKLWLGTLKEGLYCFDTNTNTFEHYNQADGLPDNTIYSIYSDRDSNLWLSTTTGIIRILNVNPDSGLSREAIRYMSRLPGKENAELNWNAHYQNRSTGEIFLGGTQGLVSYFPDKFEFNTFSPTPFITSINVNGRQVNCRNPEANYSFKNSLQIEFSASHFASPLQNKFRYRLVGVDSVWKYANSDERQAVYSDLFPGEYQFELSACSYHGQWSKTTYSYKINIAPTWWSLRLLFVFIFMVLVVVIGIAARYIKRKNHEKIPNSENEIPIHHSDTPFINHAKEIIQRYMSNPDFDNDLFVKEMGMSRSGVYLRLRQTCGKSVSEFIREQRLQYAAGLLTESSLSVSEVAYKSGFKDPSNFSRYFKTYYGISPSEYAKKHQR